MCFDVDLAREVTLWKNLAVLHCLEYIFLCARVCVHSSPENYPTGILKVKIGIGLVPESAVYVLNGRKRVFRRVKF